MCKYTVLVNFSGQQEVAVEADCRDKAEELAEEEVQDKVLNYAQLDECYVEATDSVKTADADM